MAVSSAIRREVRWRVTGTTAWSDIQTCSPVAELTLEGLDRTKSYDVEIRDISACGAKSAWVLHSAVIPDVAPGNLVLSDVYAAAAAAQADATSSLAQLSDIASDGQLTADEKVEAKQRYNTLTAEQSGIDAQATSYGITTEKTNYDSAITSLKNYLQATVGVLDASFVWTGITGTTTITRATWDSTWTTAYTAKTTLLNAIYAAAKSKADAAQATANTATGQVTQLPVINGGFDMVPTGYGWTADNGTWFTDTTSISPGVQPNCARRNGSSGTPTDVYRNAGLTPVYAGQVVKTQALIKAVSANGSCYVRINWLRADLSEISQSNGNAVTGTATAGSFAVGPAPTGAVFARTELVASAHTAGYYLADNVVCTQYPSNIDEVPDGVTNSRTLAIRVNGGKPVIDFSEGIHFNKQLDNIGDGSTYYRMPAANMDGSRRALIDFTQGSHVGKILDNIGDGATYGRPLGSRLNAGNPLIDFSANYHLNKNVDNLADGSTYARTRASGLQSGVLTNLAFGSNKVPNPQFSSNLVGVATGIGLQNQNVCDGWYVGGVQSQFAVIYESSGGASNILLRLASGAVLPANSGYQAVSAGTLKTFPVKGGAVYRLQGLGNVSYASVAPAGIAFIIRTRIGWYDAQGGYISESYVDSGYAPGNFTHDGQVTAPTNAKQAFAAIYLFFNNTTASPITTSALVCEARWGYVSVSEVFELDSDIQDGATYGRTVQSRLSSGVPFIDFAAGIHLNKNVDNVGDGSTFARIKGTELSSGIHKLGVAGSGALLGNQLNIPNSLTLNYGAVRSATALTASSTGAVSVNAFTYYMGAAAVNYSAVSNAVTGLTQGSTYYIYTRDPGGTGGTKTWSATTNVNALLQTYDDIVVAGQVTIPTSGTSGGGGIGGCPVVGAWVIRRTADGWAFARAGEVTVGDELLLTSGQWGRVSQSRAVLQPCVIVRDDDGYALSCSRSAPLGRPDGSQVLAPDASGELIESRTGAAKGASRIATVRDIGEQLVQHITCENDFFWVGDEPGRLFSHHNLKP